MIAALAPAVFLDKDGTLVENVPHNVDPRQIRLSPGAGRALASLAGAGYRLVVVSNQPGVGLGRFSLADLDAVSLRLRELAAAHGADLAGIYYCPHAPRARELPGCVCRKPRPGLLVRAARELSLDLWASWMVGDILDDVEAGRRAGCRTILVDNGNETEWRRSALREPTLTVADLATAAEAIIHADAGMRRRAVGSRA